jgi:hypothetical protein
MRTILFNNIEFLPVPHNGEARWGTNGIFLVRKNPIYTPPNLPTVRRGEEISL